MVRWFFVGGLASIALAGILAWTGGASPLVLVPALLVVVLISRGH